MTRWPVSDIAHARFADVVLFPSAAPGLVTCRIFPGRSSAKNINEVRKVRYASAAGERRPFRRDEERLLPVAPFRERRDEADCRQPSSRFLEFVGIADTVIQGVA